MLPDGLRQDILSPWTSECRPSMQTHLYFQWCLLRTQSGALSLGKDCGEEKPFPSGWESPNMYKVAVPGNCGWERRTVGLSAVLTPEWLWSKCPGLRCLLRQRPFHKEPWSATSHVICQQRRPVCLDNEGSTLPIACSRTLILILTTTVSTLSLYTLSISYEKDFLLCSTVCLTYSLVSYKTKASFLRWQEFFHFPANSNFWSHTHIYKPYPGTWLQKHHYLYYRLN